MHHVRFTIGLFLLAICCVGCVSSPRFTSTKMERREVGSVVAVYEEGVASYYADEFNGRQTSNGEVYDMNQLTAAHRTLPFNTKVKVTNTLSGKSVVVRINDRGPFKDDRIIDVSLAAARSIELIGTGTAKVRLEVLEIGDNATIRKP